jgi:hypothetical protein
MKRPSFCLVLRHALRGFHFRRLPLRAAIGLILVAINVPVGWGGAAVCAYFSIRAASASERAAWGTASAVVYGLSWGMLFLGIVLAGKETVRNFQQHLPRAWKAWRRATRIQSSAQ